MILPRRQPFEILYRLNCDNLCADFKEDLEFRFSYGIITIVNRLHGVYSSFFVGKRKPDSPASSVIPSTPSSEQVDGGLFDLSNGVTGGDAMLAMLTKFALSNTMSHGAMGGLLVFGFVFKTVSTFDISLDVKN